MPLTTKIISILAILLFLGLVLRLILQEKLEEKYALVWCMVGVILLVLVWFDDALSFTAKALGIVHTPTFIFLSLSFGAIIFFLHLSVVNSKLKSQVKNLTHEIAFLKKLTEDLKNSKKAEKSEI